MKLDVNVEIFFFLMQSNDKYHKEMSTSYVRMTIFLVTVENKIGCANL